MAFWSEAAGYPTSGFLHARSFDGGVWAAGNPLDITNVETTAQSTYLMSRQG